MDLNLDKLSMKKLIGLCVITTLICAFENSCKKNNSTNGLKPTIYLSKTTVQRGEPLIVSTNVPGYLDLVCTVEPSTNSWIIPESNRSVILFSASGSYTITTNF